MTPEQIIELADDCGAGVYKYQFVSEVSIDFETDSLMKFAKLIETATREDCAKLVEQDLYPDDSGKPYTKQYNFSIKVLADKIRSGT